MGRHLVTCLAKPNAAVLDLDVERRILDTVDAEIALELYEDCEPFRSARTADAILHRGGFLDAARIAQLQNCRIIAHAGIGFDAIDVEAATRQGIFVTNVAEYCIDEVSSHALSLLLALNRRLFSYSRLTRTGGWASQSIGRIDRLNAMTVAVIGYGRIGSALGRKAESLGMRVLAVDPYVERQSLGQRTVQFCELHEALPKADFVSLHTPLNQSTRGMIGESQFALMKASAYLINTARGGVVDERALIEALQTGRIAGAGIDVLTVEPPDSANALLSMENVIVTPHAAYYSEASVMEVRRTTATQIVDVLCGKLPAHVLNPHVRNGSAHNVVDRLSTKERF